MAKRKKISRQNNKILYIFIFLGVNFLLLVKLLGDIVIALIKLPIILLIKTYNILTKIFSILFRHLQIIFEKFQILNKGLFTNELKYDKPSDKQKVIFSRRLSSFYQLQNSLKQRFNFFRKRFIKAQRMLAFKIGKLTYEISCWFKSFFLKAKYFSLGALTVCVLALFYQTNLMIKSLPNPLYLSRGDIPTTTKIYDRNGKLLYEIYAEKNRTPVKLSEIPETVKKATLAIEDKDFYNHHGFSFPSIIRAIYHNLTSDTLQGASTITQQLIKSTLLTPEKTITRKIKEFILSVWAEKIYSKDQILEMYLNQVPYGGTAWGVESASQMFFGKSVKDVTLAQAAFLAGLPASPTRFSPYGIHPETAKIRQEQVIDKMISLGFISSQEGEEAKEEQLTFRKQIVPIAAPHFVMFVREVLEEKLGPRMVSDGGLRVITTLDLDLQEKTQKIVSEQIENLRHLSVGNGAALITDPKTGEILSMVGSVDYFDDTKQGNVNLTTALRQPGSSIKVVTYATALKMGWTPASIINDTPIVYRTIGQTSYAPVNYDGKFHGKVTLRTALGSSYNIPAVKVLSSIGIKNMIDQGRLMGIDSWNDDSRFGLSLTLGGGEVTMLDMAEVYGTLANLGKRIDLTPFKNITTWQDENLSSSLKQKSVQATSPEVAFLLSDILSDNKARTPAFGRSSALFIPGRTVAVKTGTSDNKRDNWTIGYTPDYVVVVWVGNNNNSPMHPTLTSGVTGAAPIWNQIMNILLEGKEDKPFPKPQNIITLSCYGKTEYFIKGTEPKGGCPKFPTTTPDSSFQ